MKALNDFSEHMNVKFNTNIIQAAISAFAADHISFTKHDIHVFITNECKDILSIANATYFENKPLIETALSNTSLHLMDYEATFDNNVNAYVYGYVTVPSVYDPDFVRFKKYKLTPLDITKKSTSDADIEDDLDEDDLDEDEIVVYKNINKDYRVRIPSEMVKEHVTELYIHKDDSGNIVILPISHELHGCSYEYITTVVKYGGEFRITKNQILQISLKTSINLYGKKEYKFKWDADAETIYFNII